MSDTPSSSSPASLTAYCDGGSRGNPGPSGYGVFIEGPAGERVAELSEFLGSRTNNYAEYSGLLAALAYAVANGCEHLRVVADSELMVKQMKGQYRVNSPDLKPLWEEAKRRAGQLKRFEIQHVLRGKNKDADRLANEAMDKGTGRGPAGRPGARTPEPARATPKEPAPMRLGVSRLDRQAAAPEQEGAATASAEPAAPAPPRELPAEVTGFVKNGVVHLVQGELPEGTFVRILPGRR